MNLDTRYRTPFLSVIRALEERIRCWLAWEILASLARKQPEKTVVRKMEMKMCRSRSIVPSAHLDCGFLSP